MSQSEDEFLQRLRATFIVEADEHVQAMASGMLALEKTPPDSVNPTAIETIFRHAHSLKGAARATNSAEIEAICQALETVFAAWKRERIALAAENFDTLHRAIDLIGALVRSIGATPSPENPRQLSGLLRELAALAIGETAAPSRPVGSERATPAKDTPMPAVEDKTPAPAPVPPAPEAPPPAARSSSDTIRISTAKLDRLLLNAEEMLAVKQNAAQRSADLRTFDALFGQWAARWARLQPEFRQLRTRENAVPAAAASTLAEFLEWNSAHIKALEGKLRALAKSTTQDHHEAAKRVDDLLAESKQLVMLPFSTLADFLPKLVRDLSRDQGRDVALVVRGGEVEVDKRILEEMKDALVHLVRNAIDHGIERPDHRAAQGKPPQATLTVAVATGDGNKVEIVVSDDGAGIDLERVKKSAVERGLLAATDAPTLDPRRAIDLIFQSELSTSPIITEISGRGLGLAIVREKTENLGGSVVVETRPGAGTAFRIVLPVTLATFRGVLVTVRGTTYVVPTAHVERVARIRTTDTKTVENRETISLNDRVVPLVWLDEVLDSGPSAGGSSPRDYVPVVLIGFGRDQIAFAVDEVLHDEEVLVKGLKRPLSRVRNVAGATVLGSGRLAVILNAADLLKSARKAGNRRDAPQSPPFPVAPSAKAVLLAEDSITSRMLLKGILEAAGYRVKTAVDGLEAWTTLRTGDFDVIVSDVEMPRMNGFDLTAHIRADKKLADKPVVLVTALASQADRERGIDVGANAYIVKSSFDQSNLLEVIRRLA